MRNTAILLLLGAGCVLHAYKGPRRDMSETSLVLGSSVNYENDDGSRTRLALNVVGADGGTTAGIPGLEVLPGRHSVTISWARREWVDRPMLDVVSVFTLAGGIWVGSGWETREEGTITMDLEVEAGYAYQFVPLVTPNGPPTIETRSCLRTGRGRYDLTDAPTPKVRS